MKEVLVIALGIVALGVAIGATLKWYKKYKDKSGPKGGLPV